MKKRYFYLIVAVFFSVLSHPVAAGLKIGFVNTLKIMKEAPQVVQAEKRLRKKFEARERTLRWLEQQIKKLEKNYERKAPTITESEAIELKRQIRSKRIDLKQQIQEFEEDQNIQANKERARIHKIILQVIQKLAKKGSYDLILTETAVVWRSERVDLTDKVLRYLHRIAR